MDVFEPATVMVDVKVPDGWVNATVADVLDRAAVELHAKADECAARAAQLRAEAGGG